MSSTKAGKMYVTFWGTRGSISTPGRGTEKYGGNTPCVYVQCQDAHIIMDAGTGIRNLGLDLMEQYEEECLSLHLLLSHTHWDHIQGLPFFQAAYRPGNELIIYGSSSKERFLESVLKRQMDTDFFPVELCEMAADVKIREISDKKIEIGPVVVDWQEQIFHPGGSVRYRLMVGEKSVAYATDVELDLILRGGLKDEEREKFLQDYLDFIQDVDLLIGDGQYSAEEYREKGGWGHTSIPVIVELANRANVKQLAVFHHDPQHSDRTLDAFWGEYLTKGDSAATSVDVIWAREGMTLAI